MHYLVFYNFVDGYLEKRGPFRRAHLEMVREYADNGSLLLAGALADPADSAVLVFRGPTEESAESFVKNDPYVINGLVTSWHMRKWMTVVGDGAPFPSL